MLDIQIAIVSFSTEFLYVYCESTVAVPVFNWPLCEDSASSFSFKIFKTYAFSGGHQTYISHIGKQH